MSVKWNRCRAAFAPDGALRDVYVLGTDASHWKRALDLVRASCSSLRLLIGDEERTLPGDSDGFLGFFELGEGTRALLLFDRDGLRFFCQFFSTSEIEFSFGPEDVDGPKRLAALEQFMRDLGRATGKEVIVTPENCEDRPFLLCQPSDGVVTYVPPA